MPYVFFRNILDTVLANFSCPQCGNHTNEQVLQIIGIDSTHISISIRCHVCSTESRLQAEINPIASNLLQDEDGRKFFEKYIQNGGQITSEMIHKPTPAGEDHEIGAEDIRKVRAELDDARSIEDIL